MMSLVGLPLWYKRPNPIAVSQALAIWITTMQPHDGFASYEWMDNVGPVLVYRPGGLGLSFDDIIMYGCYQYLHL